VLSRGLENTTLSMYVRERYVPSLWVEQMDSLPDVGKNEINVVNQQLVNRLKSTDTAFSLGLSVCLSVCLSRDVPRCACWSHIFHMHVGRCLLQCIVAVKYGAVLGEMCEMPKAFRLTDWLKVW